MIGKGQKYQMLELNSNACLIGLTHAVVQLRKELIIYTLGVSTVCCGRARGKLV